MLPETMNKRTDNERRAGSNLVANESGTPPLNPNALANRAALMMGAILVANGKLRQDQIELILNEQRITGQRFGETAIRMRNGANTAGGIVGVGGDARMRDSVGVDLSDGLAEQMAGEVVGEGAADQHRAGGVGF